MSRKKRSDAFSEAVVGLFMVAVLGLLVYFTIVISGVDVLKGREKVIARVAFESVGGLKDHDSVMYRGTKVGGVEDVEVTPSNLVVSIEIDNSVVIREGYSISVCSLSMLGGQFLRIDEGEGEIVSLTGGILRGDTPTDWMRDVALIARNLKDLTEDENIQTIITNVVATTASARMLAERVESGEGTLGKLLSSDDSVYADITNSVADAKALMANAAEISERLKAGEGTMGKLLSSDDALYRDLKDSVAAFKKACDQVKLPENMDKDVSKIMEDGKRLVANLSDVSERIKKGEGTLGKLTTEPQMYDEVQGLIKDVRQVIDNYRDTTPISTFGSLIMGGL